MPSLVGGLVVMGVSTISMAWVSSVTAMSLALFGLAWGFLFDWLMDVWAWTSLGGGATSFVALASTGIWFDVAHAAGNVLLALAVGPTLIRMLDRYARRLHGTFVPLEQT